MTDQQHPITPPPELVEQWRTKPEFADPGHTTVVSMTQSRLRDIATQASRWGWDQRNETIEAELQEARDVELEGCCEWVVKTIPSWAPHTLDEQLRAARRPKQPSLKAQAIAVLDDCSARIDAAHENIIRRALEALDD